jgi:hypothetical protein
VRMTWLGNGGEGGWRFDRLSWSCDFVISRGQLGDGMSWLRWWSTRIGVFLGLKAERLR